MSTTFDLELMLDSDETLFAYDMDENESDTVVRGQYMLDGCETLEEVIETLRAQADIWEEQLRQGYELIGIITDDRGVARYNG